MPDVPYLGEFLVTTRRGAENAPGIRPEPFFGPAGTFTGPNGPPASPPSPAEEPLEEVTVTAERERAAELPAAQSGLYGLVFGALPAPRPAPRRRAPPRRTRPPAKPRRPRPPARRPIPPDARPGEKPWWWPELPAKKPWWWPRVKPSNPLTAALAAVGLIGATLNRGLEQIVTRARASGSSGGPTPPPWSLSPPLAPPVAAPSASNAPLPWLGTVTVSAPRPTAPPLLRPLPLPGPLPLPFAPPLPGPQPSPRPQPRPETRPQPLPNPLPEPLPLPRPLPRLNPRPGPRPSPLTFSSPLTGVGTLTLPLPQPTPREELDKCDCRRKQDKPKKPKKPRDECYRGTYIEKANGLIKHRKDKIPCQ